MIGDLLSMDSGKLTVFALGTVVFITAVFQWVYGITKGYAERVDIHHISKTGKRLIHLSAWIGYASRGIILRIIGYFLWKALSRKTRTL